MTFDQYWAQRHNPLRNRFGEAGKEIAEQVWNDCWEILQIPIRQAELASSVARAESAAAERQRTQLAVDFVSEIADEPCSYGDNCPPDHPRHGQCLHCRARSAMPHETTSPSTTSSEAAGEEG